MSSIMTALRSAFVPIPSQSSESDLNSIPDATTQSSTTATAAEYAAKDEIPQADLKVAARAPRPQIVGPEVPEAPFPIQMVGPVQTGFGRGGKDLGCPTGNVIVHPRI